MIDVLALATYTFVMSITPGPNNVMLTASGANFGFRRTLPHMAGIAVGFTVQSALVCLGLGAVPWLQVALAWAGGAYLVWMGWKLVGAGAVGDARAARPLTFIEAALFQSVNPKAWVFAVTVASLFMPHDSSPWAPVAAITAVLLVVNLPSITVWTLFGSALRRFLDVPARRRGFNALMALALVGTAVVMVSP